MLTLYYPRQRALVAFYLFSQGENHHIQLNIIEGINIKLPMVKFGVELHIKYGQSQY
jgi:hypothetical protein